MKIHKSIWLQYYGDDGDMLDEDNICDPDITWCQDKINESDVKYVLADELERLKAIESAAQNMCDVRGRHHSELAMKRLIEVCKGKQDDV